MASLTDLPNGVRPYVAYRRVLLSPARIRELSVLNPRRAIADAALCWCWILAAFTVVTLYPSWWTVLFAVPVIGNRYYALFLIGHDGMHRRFFPNVRKNDFWTDLLVLAPIGAITRINNKNHLAHHHNLATSKDPDRHKHACFNKGSRPELLGFLSGLLSVWNSTKAVFFTRGWEHRDVSPSRSRSSSYTMRDFCLLSGWFLVLCGGLTFAIGWWAYPVLWLFAVYMFMFLADNFRSFAEHSHPEGDAAADQHRLITYVSNPIERAFIAPMNMNCHAVHHLWPSIPYYNLPAADHEVRHCRESTEGLLWRSSYFAYLLRYWCALPITECAQRK